MATSCIHRAARQAASPASSPVRSQLCLPRRQGPTARPGPEVPNSTAPQRLRPEFRTGTCVAHMPHLPRKVGRQEKKKKVARAASLEPRSLRLPPSRQRAARGRGPPGSAGLPAPSPRASRARPRLGTYLVPLLSVQVFAVFTWVFKQVSGRKKKGGKIQLCK